MRIEPDGLQHPDVQALLAEHLGQMQAQTPAGSVHALDLSRLRAPGIVLWCAWDGGTLLGCGALRELSPTHGEVKSMRTVAAHRGRGVARAILRHLLAVARDRGYHRLSLETGASAPFLPAIRLYESEGFRRCGPFADYREDPHSVFMTRAP